MTGLGVNWPVWWALIGAAVSAAALTFWGPEAVRRAAHFTAWAALAGAILLPAVTILRGTPQ